MRTFIVASLFALLGCGPGSTSGKDVVLDDTPFALGFSWRVLCGTEYLRTQAGIYTRPDKVATVSGSGPAFPAEAISRLQDGTYQGPDGCRFSIVGTTITPI